MQTDWAQPSTTAEQDRAGAVLGRAFVDDPMFTVLTDPVRRAAALPLIFRSMARQTARHGRIDLTDDATGAALWMPADTTDIGVVETIRYGFLRAGAAGGLWDMLRLARVQDAIARHHHELCPGAHGYLFALGVDPRHQGQGVGSGLLARGLARLDERHLPAYLETNLPQNVRLYERNGFEVRRHLPADAAKPFDTWLMLRPAR